VKENPMKNEAASKSEQRRIKEQTGQDVPLSAAATAAHVEHATASDSVKNALRPGGRAAASPILGLAESMLPNEIANRFNSYRDAERTGMGALLAKIDLDLGAKVRIADKARKEKFAAVKKTEDTARQLAQKEYTIALRAAKSALDAANALITKEADTSRETHRQEFNNEVEPINSSLKASKEKFAAEYQNKITAAVEEMKPIAEAAQKREEKRKAELTARMEADAAAKKAAEVEASITPPVVVPSTFAAASA
jgi:hypothetical protein